VKHVEILVNSISQRLKSKGERLTDIRREVLRALCSAPTAIGAYDLLALINKKRERALSTMSLYRTLDFLQTMGIVLKVDSRNVYMICQHGGHHSGHVIMMCNNCGDAKEIDERTVMQKLTKLAVANHLKLQRNVIEMHGLCSKCH
jgi:Fur family zinc uptake transcriptional regulator